MPWTSRTSRRARPVSLAAGLEAICNIVSMQREDRAMNYEAGKLKRPITDQVRASVTEDLPEINQIMDVTLRTKAIEAWAHALCESSFQRIRDIPGEGNPGVFTLKRG